MSSTFDERMRECAAMVGDGKLTGKLVVDQIYALAIHSGFWRTGPLMGVTNRPRHGGETHFLTKARDRNAPRYLRNLASSALEPGGLVAAMVENVEDWARDSGAHTPRETGVLAGSHHPLVLDRSRPVYDRPPLVKRLSKDELKRRREFLPRRHFGGGR